MIGWKDEFVKNDHYLEMCLYQPQDCGVFLILVIFGIDGSMDVLSCLSLTYGFLFVRIVLLLINTHRPMDKV